MLAVDNGEASGASGVCLVEFMLPEPVGAIETQMFFLHDLADTVLDVVLGVVFASAEGAVNFLHND